MTSPPPPLTALGDLPAQLASAGWAVLDAATLARLCGLPLTALPALQPAWQDLPPDAHLRDGGRYRRRRHGCFVVDGSTVVPAPHRAHWQPLEYNALHGGIERWFEPLSPAMTQHPARPGWRDTLVLTCRRGGFQGPPPAPAGAAADVADVAEPGA